MTYTRWLPVALTAGLMACAFPAVAGATDYCVDATPACGPKNVASFEAALSQAATADDADRVFLGPGTHTAPPGNGFAYTNQTGPVEIIGSGQAGGDPTILTAQPGTAGYGLQLFGGPGTSIHDLRVHLPQNAASKFTGLRTSGTARNVIVSETLPQPNERTGVELTGGVLEDSLVFLGLTNSTGVLLDYAGGTVRNSSATGYRGILATHGGSIEGAGVVAERQGILALQKQTIVRSTAIDVQGSLGIGIAAHTDGTLDAEVIADGVNIIGSNIADGTAVSAATTFAPDHKASVTLRNSILRGFGTTLDATKAVGAGAAHVSASYSDYGSGRTHSTVGATIDELNISNFGDSGFEDALDGDFHLLPGSPLVDAGDPSTPQGLDANGKPLVTDGNLDGVARRDIGAYELAGPLPGEPTTGGGAGSGGGPVAGADRVSPILSRFTASTARRPRLRYTLSEPARVTIAIQRVVRRDGRTRYRTVGRVARNGAKGLNSTVLKGRIGGRVLRAGRYRAVARATDVAENRSAAKRATFRVVGR